jgi:hypothetical protein
LLLLMLVPLFSCSQIRELIAEYQSNFKVKDEQGPVNPSEEKTTDILAGCNEELAFVDRKAWEAYLADNLILDDQSLDTIPAGIYTVFVQFVIDKKGKISDVSVLKDPGFGFGKRVKKVLYKYQDSWQPAKLNGRLMVSYQAQRITFIIEEEEDCEESLTGELIL